MINDENMKTLAFQHDPEIPGFAEFCDVCFHYNPEVVIAYD